MECELGSLHLDVQCIEFHRLLLNAILCVGGMCTCWERGAGELNAPILRALNVMIGETKLKQ